MGLDKLKEKGEAPDFLTEEGYSMLKGGYLREGETPKDMFKRVAKYAADHLKKPDMIAPFFDILWKNWLCGSTPVLSNSGTSNLPISCYGGGAFIDSTEGILEHINELSILTKFGGGVGSYFGNIRSKGAKISSGGTTDGIIPFAKILESHIDGIKQSATRRGAVALYNDFSHGDIEEFIDIRRPTGDLTRRCLTTAFHNAIILNDEDMYEITTQNGRKRDLWNRLMNMRVETGEPYLMFKGNANKNCPESYSGRIIHSQLCSEIFLPSSEFETFVCCLSSLNLARYDEWKDWKCSLTNKTVVELSIYFLDGIMSGFIHQASTKSKYFENAVNFARNHRALGLGTLGWHTLLQKRMLSWESFEAMMLNSEVFKNIREQADKASLDLGKEYGECKETFGTGRRNTVTLAIAPNMSSAVIGGGVSQSTEPITANLFAQAGSKGTFFKKNPQLEQILESKGMNTSDVWMQINLDKGSVRNLTFLSEEEKNIFLTAREINQFSIIKQAAQRQKYIDQGASINLFFSLPETQEDKIKVAKYINEVHLEAWRSGIKSLYYLKTASPIKGASLTQDISSCIACEG